MTCQEARDLMLECMTGSTPPDRRRALVAHLQTCPGCAAEVQGFEETVALLKSVPEPRVMEAQWEEFASALQGRLAREATSPWGQLRRWLRQPRVAWGTAVATATVIVILAGSTFLRPSHAPVALTNLPPAWHGLVTDSMAQMAPSMTSTLAVWDAQLAEVPPETIPGE